MSINESISNLEAAINYAEFGWSLLPLCWPDENGLCGCGHGHQGKEVGKAPLIKGGHRGASSNVRQVREWWERWPRANIGVNLAKSGLIVVDCDSVDAVREAQALGVPKGVPYSLTGGGGVHFYYSNPTGILRRRTKWGRSGAIDLLSDGYVILPPSRHASGKTYRWRRAASGKLPSPPLWAIGALESMDGGHTLTAESIPHDVEDRARSVLRRVSMGWRQCFEEVANDRSERSAALALAAVEAGVTDILDVAAFVYQSASHQDKFRDRSDGWKDALRCARRALESRSTGAAYRGTYRIISARDLAAMNIPEPNWAVPGLIPQGVTLLAGKPKMGKSWMALQIAVATATGGKALGSIEVEPGAVLYLALEDTLRRLQSRLEKLQGARVELVGNRLSIDWGEFDPPEQLWFVTEWPRFDQGGVQAIDDWLSEHPDARLIVIDTLAKVRPTDKGSGNLYSEDYRAIEGLKSLVDRYNVAALVIHHLRKATSNDPLETISGSTGLTGAVDATLVLKRERTRADAELYVVGRDVEERELALSWDRDSARWTILGEAHEYKRSTARADIINVLRNASIPLSPSDVAEILNKSPNSIKKLMWQMSKDGQLVPNGDGLYSINPLEKW